MVVVAARITGSLASAILLVAVPANWEQIRSAYSGHLRRRPAGSWPNVPTVLPPVAPNRDQVVYLRDRIAASPRLMEMLTIKFTARAIATAQSLGNLKPDVEPDWAHPVAEHMIYGDGTILAPYSDVMEVRHPATGELFAMGSRAKSHAKARIARHRSRTEEDGKSKPRSTDAPSM